MSHIPIVVRQLKPDEVDRILRRAAQLEGAERPVGVSESELEKIAEEVGLSATSVRQAMLELHAAAPLEANAPAGFSGEILTERLTQTQLPELRSQAAAYTREQHFTVKRDLGERVLFEPNVGAAARLLRAVNWGGGYELRNVDELELLFFPRGDGRTQTRIIARLTRLRRSALLRVVIPVAWVAAANALVSAMAVADSTFLAGLALVSTGAAAVVSYFAARHWYRANVSRVTTALERLLDRMERPQLQLGRAR